MKKIVSFLLFIVCLVPLHAAILHIHSDDYEPLHIIVHPSNHTIHYYHPFWGFGIHSGLGPNTGRSLNHLYPIYFLPIDRWESLMNNSGTGAHGPGTY
jgi:hypothetical protein